MTSHAEAVVRAVQLEKVFGEGEGAVHALAGVDLVVPSGQFLAIMGASGSGKSTLLNVIGGLEPPTSGTISLEGADLAALDDDALTLLRRRRIGFVFQSFNLLPTLTSRENVAFPLVLDGMPAAAAQAKADAMLDRLGMTPRAGSHPATLSGGEQQRVAIARALAIDPALILADEPTGNLDTAATDHIVALLRSLSREFGKTLVVVTHNPLVAEQADRTVVLRDGLIVSDTSSR